MTTKAGRNDLAITPSLAVCSLVAMVIGCGQADPASSLPPPEAEAVKALRAANAKFALRDGNVTYIDYYQVTGVPNLLVHLKSLPHVEAINFSGTDVTMELRRGASWWLGRRVLRRFGAVSAVRNGPRHPPEFRQPSRWKRHRSQQAVSRFKRL